MFMGVQLQNCVDWLFSAQQLMLMLMIILANLTLGENRNERKRECTSFLASQKSILYLPHFKYHI
jgi:hypothetical protein